MKKLLFFAISSLCVVNSFGQLLCPAVSMETYDPWQTAASHGVAAKTTAVIHDTLLMTNLPATGDTATLYNISHTGTATDSGYLAGTDGFGYSGFAERYDFASADSTVQVIGIYALFGGKVNPATTKTLTLKVWSPAAPITVRSTLKYSGFPGAVIDSGVTSIKNIGIGATVDTYKAFYFATPTAYLTTSFFVGYTINYNFASLAGDTIGLQTTRLGERASAEYTVASGDTTVNTQNAILDTATWLDVEANMGFKLDFYVFPIVNTKNTLSVKGITRNDLTFFGSYPNPATNSTNIKFALNKSTDVTIQLTDMGGRVVNTVVQNGLSTGEHTVSMETGNLPSGEYLYLVRTAEGDGIAGKLTVIK